MPRFRDERRDRRNTNRPVNTRQKLIKILIVCEGRKTEPNYFRSFPVRADVDVIFEEGAGNTVSLVERAIELVASGNYRLNLSHGAQPSDEPLDQVWCVFDRDSFPNGNFNAAIQRAESNNFYCAYTNEAFELWYIIHFEYHVTAYSREVYKSMLTQRLGREYKKNDDAIYKDLIGRQPTAIRNAKRLLAEYGDSHNPERNNPCTTVHKLVEVLNEHLR